jgi:hypothetical protein
MKPTFKINGQEFQFGDITLRTYYGLKEVLAKGETREAEFEIVQCMTGCPAELLKQLKFTDWLLVWEEAILTLNSLTGDADAIRPIIEFNGVRYGLPAVEDLTIGEFADLDIILSSSKAEDKLADIAAVLYRPIIKEKGAKIVLEPYDTDGFETRKEAFMELSITAVRSANAFFLQSANSLLRNTAESLVQKGKMNSIPRDVLDRLQAILQQDPGGEQSISLQEDLLLSLKKHPSSRFAQLSTGLAGRRTKFVNTIWPFRRKQNTK